MRLQMQLPEQSVLSLKRVLEDTKAKLDQRTEKFNRDRVSKMQLAATKGDQKAVAQLNRQQKELAEQHNLLTETNLIRVALALGFKEMSKWPTDEVLDYLDKHGVVRGRPRVD